MRWARSAVEALSLRCHGLPGRVSPSQYDPMTSRAIFSLVEVPGGWLAARYGAKLVFGIGVLGTSVLTLLTPVAANHSMAAILFIRVLEGFGEGVTYPAMYAMWGRWAPPAERSKLAIFGMVGSYMGTIVALPISGPVCRPCLKIPPRHAF